MLQEKIRALKQLLAEMFDPNPREYQSILEVFNTYKDTYNPNIDPLKCTPEQLAFFLVIKFINFDFFRLLREESRDQHIKGALGDYFFGLFYELVSTIKNYDPEGWLAAGFDISPDEMHILREHRNTKFHISVDALKFMERHQKFMSLASDGRFSEITDKNGDALNRYVLIQSNKYPEIKEMLDEILIPSARPNFLRDNFGFSRKDRRY